MEPILITLLVVSLLFGSHEHIQNNRLEAEVGKLRIELKDAEIGLQEATETNANNIITINKITSANRLLLEDNTSLREAQENYTRINENSSMDIQELEGVVDHHEWSDTGIPLELLEATRN